MADTALRANELSKKSRLLLFLLLFLPCLFVLARSLDTDIWFLLNHGRYVLGNGIPHIEPFTIHQGFHFVMQQWLSAVIFWLAYSVMGAVGVKLVVMLCFMAVVAVMFKLCMLVSDNYFMLSFFISLFISIVLLYFMVSRPYIFSSLIFALELYLLENYRVRKKALNLLFLPLLSVFLINLQAAMWPMFFVFLVPYIIETFKFKLGPFEGHGVEKKYLYPAVLLSGAAGFLNPYGLEAMLYLFKSYGYEQINSAIEEMQPVNINTTMGKIVILFILIVPVIYCSYKNGIRRLRYILLAIGTAYMVMSSARNLFLFAICAFFPLAAYLRDFEPAVKQGTKPGKTRMVRLMLVFLIILVIPLGFYGINQASIPQQTDYALLNETLDFVLEKSDARDVVLYTGYNTGNMAEFRGIPAYMDARAEVFVMKNNQKDDVFKEYIALQDGTLYYKDVLNKYGFTHILVTQADILYTYLQHDSGYRLAYSNEKYSLFEPIK